MDHVSRIQKLIDAVEPRKRDAKPDLGDPVLETFLQTIDRIVAEKHAWNEAMDKAYFDRQQLADFNRESALLSGMANMARIAMMGQKDDPASPLPSTAEDKYHFWKSRLAQLGLPDATSGLL